MHCSLWSWELPLESSQSNRTCVIPAKFSRGWELPLESSQSNRTCVIPAKFSRGPEVMFKTGPIEKCYIFQDIGIPEIHVRLFENF